MRLALAATLLAVGPLAGAAGAQSPTLLRNAATLSGGASSFDLSGTGTAPFMAGRLERLLVGRVLLGEVSLGWFRPEEQVDHRRHYLIGELALQAQAPLGPVAPYLGVGVGQFHSLGGERPTRRDPTLSGAAGLRLALPDGRWGARAELRVRGIGSEFSGAAMESTFGLSRRF